MWKQPARASGYARYFNLDPEISSITFKHSCLHLNIMKVRDILFKVLTDLRKSVAKSPSYLVPPTSQLELTPECVAVRRNPSWSTDHTLSKYWESYTEPPCFSYIYDFFMGILFPGVYVTHVNRTFTLPSPRKLVQRRLTANRSSLCLRRCDVRSI